MTTKGIKRGKKRPELRYELSFCRKVMTELFSGTMTKAALQAKYIPVLLQHTPLGALV